MRGGGGPTGYIGRGGRGRSGLLAPPLGGSPPGEDTAADEVGYSIEYS